MAQAWKPAFRLTRLDGRRGGSSTPPGCDVVCIAGPGTSLALASSYPVIEVAAAPPRYRRLGSDPRQLAWRLESRGLTSFMPSGQSYRARSRKAEGLSYIREAAKGAGLEACFPG